MLVNRITARCGAVAALMVAFLMIAPAASGQGAVDSFVQQFEKAYDASDYTRMRSLTSESRSIAFRAAKTFEAAVCRFTAEGKAEAADRYLKVLNELALVYDLEHKDDIVKKRHAWLKGLDDEQRKLRFDAVKASNEGYSHFNRGETEGGDLHYKSAVEPFTVAVDNAVKIQDWFSAADDATQLAVCYEKINDGFAACYFAHVAISAAGRIDMKERFAASNLEIHKRMKEKKIIFYPAIIRLDLPLEESRKQYAIDAAEKEKVVPGTTEDPGAGDGNSGTGGAMVPPASEAAYEWEDDTKFKPTGVDLGGKVSLIGYLRGNEASPSRIPFQPVMDVSKDADPADLRFLPGAKIQYDGKFHIDARGDGKFKTVKLKRKPATQKFNIVYDDDSKLKMNVSMWEAEKDFNLFGTPFSASDSHKYARIYAFNTTGLKGKIRGHEVTFVDCNANGFYHEAGVDAVIVGSGKSARVDPSGRYIFLEEKNGFFPYEVKVNQKNVGLVRSRPYKGQLAPLRVEMAIKSGDRPTHLIAKGSGEDSAFFLDIAKAIDSPVWVPAGGYTIHQGYFSFGKGKKETNIFIGRGRSGTFKVEAGKVNVWQLGGSGEQGFWLLGAFERGSKPSEIVAVGKEFRVFGNFGESYFGFTEGRPLPSIVIRKEDENGSKVGSSDTKHAGGSGVNEIDLWFPANETIKNCPRGKCVGQFTLDHEILGKAKSAWLGID